ncbi:hypothetical protein CAFE_16030 [Caprobacter fermentans]|uniref:Uncharacterized protein n=1 Tax=Caproicibacter fermentans TaxID=2576756 RepID=A0A6N8HYR1_9FIRM|nr:hypothetical protein [Caproicibacter fermentans]MVB10902.1 hypothetical protein [Caproicibacter fermentans]OCN01604.1 hypothetical protein A7X67_00460 [Clostridium sp. W14A]QNK39480.1 hypothetical protein HCR03_12050 [Caproicibacter fermentans]
MDPLKEKKTQDNDLIRSITYYASFQPFVGLCSSVISGLFLFFKGEPWSLAMLLYVAIPFLGFTAIYAVIAVYMKTKHDRMVPFVNRKVRIPTIVILIVLVCFQIVNSVI